MSKRKNEPHTAADPPDDLALLGYLNFSRGEPNTEFQRALNALCAEIGPGWRPEEVRDRLLTRLTVARKEHAALADANQVESVIPLVTDKLLPAYREFHRDLLFHLSDADFAQPFLLVRMFEAALAEGPPWDETSRVVAGAVERLNDFLGYRPLAVLENGRQMQPYSHERFRPVPLFIRGAGVAFGKYAELIERTLRFFAETPREIQLASYFDIDHVDEFAVDVRAYDHLQPANKRTNYMFGEWDPHHIDTKGFYRRFVVRKVILDALMTWVTDAARRDPSVKREELLYDASAVLCGTVLMASSISGSGPGMHDSTTTLTSLLPIVARQRDAFYERLLQEATGARARRLKREAKQTQQPFGHVRQRLNIELAKHGARQVQTRHLAQLYARMGYFEAARQQALSIPTPSARFECDIQCRITEAHLLTERGELAGALDCLRDVEGLLYRGIECGAIIDPWNILGFQGQFPLFHTREDSLHDLRAEGLIEIIERIFRVHAHALTESAARGQTELGREFSQRFGRLAEWWDRFATTTVADLPHVNGAESVDSARHVAAALSDWQNAGAEAGDISFWRQHVEEFQSSKAYAVVVDALLERGDQVASMGLLMQWLSEVDELGLESGPYSLTSRLLRWMRLVTRVDDGRPAVADETLTAVYRLFDYLEANAENLWQAPTLGEVATGVADLLDDDTDDDLAAGMDLDDLADSGFDDDDEDDLFGAAYDDVVFRDTADDGFAGEVADEGGRSGETPFDLLTDELEPRLRFLETLAHLWELAARPIAERLSRPDLGTDTLVGRLVPKVQTWSDHLSRLQAGLRSLMKAVADYDILPPSGDHDSNVEFDEQLQTKFYLVQLVISTYSACQAAERSLRSCLPMAPVKKSSGEESAILGTYRGILTRDAATVQRNLPALLRGLARKPLLYVPLSNDGDPEEVRQAQSLQALLRFLLAQLPRLGLLLETWQVLETAYRMERSSRPRGQAVTEFDQLFRIALRNSVDCVIHSAPRWRVGTPSPAVRERRARGKRSRRSLGYSSRRKHIRRRNAVLVELVAEIVSRYSTLWLQHSKTTRLSTVESLSEPGLWREIRDFIEDYGGDLFHARMLTLGNVRTILHGGVDLFLDYLDEVQDPLNPIRLVEDLEQEAIDREQVVEFLELIYGSVVDRIDRFVEYNTTTTQSDYGEKFYCLLDFLRVEADYERDAWNLTPFILAHEELAAHAPTDVAVLWETVFRQKNRDTAEQHVLRLRELERTHGMHLPALTDRIEERFVKVLAVNRMVALVAAAVADSRRNRRPSPAFESLRREIQTYLESTSGSGIDVAPWLRTIEKEVDRVDPFGQVAESSIPSRGFQGSVAVSLRELRRQLRKWNDESRKKRARG